MTDVWIEELYLIAVRARDAGQDRIPIHIFPTRLDDAGLRWLARRSPDSPHLGFWRNLQQGFLAFERTGAPPLGERRPAACPPRGSAITPALQNRGRWTWSSLNLA